MLHERIGGFPPPPDTREEIGKFLRHAFPLGLRSFEGLTSLLANEETGGPALVSSPKQRGRELSAH